MKGFGDHTGDESLREGGRRMEDEVAVFLQRLIGPRPGGEDRWCVIEGEVDCVRMAE